MLSLFIVQVLAAIGLVATLVSLVLGRALQHGPTEPIRVVARRKPAGGAQVVWMTGSVVVTLWPIAVLVVPQYAYDWPAFSDFPGSWIVQLFGVVLGAGGGLLFFSAARALGRHMTPEIQVHEGHELVQGGPYRRIRHPVYTAIITLAIGQTLFFLSPLIAVLAVLLAVLANYRAGLEENLLRSPEAFGAAYDAYIARTGRFLPRTRPLK